MFHSEAVGSSHSQQLDHILSRPIKPETINGYASAALEAVVELVQDASVDYRSATYDVHPNQASLEDAAFRHHGLSNIGRILDHISCKADELDDIDRIIEQTLVEPHMIIPPSTLPGVKGNGQAEFKQNGIQPRLKTILFMLANEFGLDLNDPREVKLPLKGKNDPDAMRQESYALLEIPALNRVILVCDEVGNATYVLDSAELQKAEISQPQLITMTKPELDKSLAANAALGSRLIYTDNYVENIVDLLRKPDLADAATDITDGCLPKSYLMPDVETEVISVYEFSRLHGCTRQHIKRLAEEEGMTIDKYKLAGKMPFWGLAAEQQLILKQLLESEKSATDYDAVSLQSFVNEHDIERSTVINILGGDTELQVFKFENRGRALGLTSSQQKTVLESPLMQTPRAEEGEAVSLRAFSLKLGINPKTIVQLADTTGIELGLYRFGSNIALGLTEDNIDALAATELFQAPSAKEHDVISIKRFASMTGRRRETILGIIHEKGVILDEYRFGSRLAPGLTPTQAELLSNSDALPPKGKDHGVVSVYDFTYQHGKSPGTVHRLVKELGLKLDLYTFGKHITPGLTPDDIAEITKTREFITPKASDYDAVSVRVFCEKYGESRSRIYDKLQQNGLEAKEYIFAGGKIAAGLTKEQVETLLAKN